MTNSMRLLKLDDRVQKMLVDEMISTGHARAILGLEDPEMQYTAAQKIFDEKLSVRETEKLVKQLLNPKKPAQKAGKQPGGGSLSAAGRKAEGNCGNEGFHSAEQGNKGKNRN